jgi:hypothetical protein
MKAIPNRVVLFRLLGIWAGCMAVPPLLWHYVGPALGALGAAGAAALWFSQYRLPAWEGRNEGSFWFVASGYGIIGITLLMCLGRLLLRLV